MGSVRPSRRTETQETEGSRRKHMELHEWQKPLARRQTDVLREGKVMLSACHTGSGKTYLACQTIKDLALPTLIVCPKVARSQWRSVVDGMGCKDFVIDIVNPERLVAGKNPYYSDKDGWAIDGRLLVWDEVHRGCSGEDSKQTLAAARWCNKHHPGNKELLMSATPFETPQKMRLIGYLMGFHRFTKQSFYDWMRTKHCGFVDIGWGARKRRIFRFTTNRAVAEETMRLIRHEMGARFMSITPDEIPGFPEETREVMLLDLDKRDHEGLVRAYAEMPEQMTRMSQDDLVKTLRLRQQAEFFKAEAVAKEIVQKVSEGYSVFRMVNFTDARTRLENCLRDAKVPFASIYGGQNEKERQQGIDAFQSNQTHVMVGMAAACSVALSLHDEKHERPRVSYISPGYSASEFSQGLGRIRRVGGTPVTQYIDIAAGSVEEKVGRTIERKMNNLSALTDRDLMR